MKEHPELVADEAIETSAIPTRQSQNEALALIQSMRPREWTKNLLLFAGLVFSGHLLVGDAILRAVVAAVAFSLASSGIYIVNDLVDIQRDRRHPVKRYRPLASGRLSRPVAIAGVAIVFLLAIALGSTLAWLPDSDAPQVIALHLWPFSLAIRPGIPSGSAWTGGDPYAAWGGSAVLFVISILVYIALQFAYSFRLKHIVLLDVFAIAAGFVLRTMAGAVAVAVPISAWLYLCTILLSLFLALSKRRQEVLSLSDGGVAHREILREYSPQLLDQLITIVTSATIMAYSLYTFQSDSTGDRRLMLTIPFVIFGIFRYLYLVQTRHLGGNPAEVLLRDRHVQGAVVGWILVAGFVLYVLPH